MRTFVVIGVFISVISNVTIIIIVTRDFGFFLCLNERNISLVEICAVI